MVKYKSHKIDSYEVFWFFTTIAIYNENQNNHISLHWSHVLDLFYFHKMATNKKPKKKYKPSGHHISNAVLFNIPLTEVEKQKLIQPPVNALKALIADNGDVNDWYVVAFRVYSGLCIALEHYTDEAIVPLYTAKETIVKIFEKYKNLDDSEKWILSADEKEQLEIVIEAINEMQGQITRRILHTAYVKTQAYMKQFEKMVEA